MSDVLFANAKRVAPASHKSMFTQNTSDFRHPLFRKVYDYYHFTKNFTVSDARWGYFSLLPNLYRYYGWNPGNRIFEWFGDKIEQKTGNKDATFQDV